MIVIGITGPIGCGKSYVSHLLEQRGLPSIDADEVYHSLVSSPSAIVKAIADTFGDGVLTETGALNRKALSTIVFSDSEKLARLNTITHAAVTDEIERQLKEYAERGTQAVTVQVPLMFESGFDKRCDHVIAVVASEEKRVERICSRNLITRAEAQKRIKNQKDIQFYIAKSSETVYNNGKEDLIEQIDSILEWLRSAPQN